MKLAKTPLICALASTALAMFIFITEANAVDADAAKALAKKSNCLRCHGIDKDKDGPAYAKISGKYQGMAGAEEKLIKHLASGEKAKFPDGHEEDHMILKADDPADIKNLVDWILSLPPQAP